MSTNKPGPINDFRSLAKVWSSELKPGPSAPSHAAATVPAAPALQQSAVCTGTNVKPAHQEKNGILLSENPINAVANLQQELRERSLEAERLRSRLSELESDLDQQCQISISAVTVKAAQDVLENQKATLAASEQALALDRSIFEAELAELDQVKRREAVVSAREEECAKRQAALERREAKLVPFAKLQKEVKALVIEVSSLEAAARSAKGKLTRKSNELAAISSELVQTQGQLEQEKQTSRELRAKLKEMSQEVSVLSEQRDVVIRLQEQTKVDLARLHAQVAALKSTALEPVDLFVGDEALLQWLGREGKGDAIEFFSGCELGWTGVGSYESGAFDILLDDLGFVQRNLPHESITHVVVGREGWSRDGLLAQIACRGGDTLRIYSQEMLLAAFMTGRDPLDADKDVLNAFKRGHPALEFLANTDFAWPSVNPIDTSVIEELGIESVRVKESPLKLLGYHVGSYSHLSPASRRRILQDAFQRAKLPWVQSDAYMAKWGVASSHQRLWRIATHIAWLANTQGRAQDKKIAQREWVEDLGWLRENLYAPRRYRFTWPDVDVS